MPQILLNGRELEVKTGLTLLGVAQQNGVSIPTLCRHPGLGPYGACRLCLVEIKKGARPGLVSSCTFPAMDGIVVETDSPVVKNARRLVGEMLLARAPECKEIRALALSLGVTQTDIPPKDELCVLCGRCVRACKALGVDAISFVKRGVKRRVSIPFEKPSEQCIACQACVTVCPTGAVKAMVTPQEVEMVQWLSHQPLTRCTLCDKPFVTAGQKTHVAKTVEPDRLAGGDLCPRCRRKETAKDLATLPKTGLHAL